MAALGRLTLNRTARGLYTITCDALDTVLRCFSCCCCGAVPVRPLAVVDPLECGHGQQHLAPIDYGLRRRQGAASCPSGRHIPPDDPVDLFGRQHPLLDESVAQRRDVVVILVGLTTHVPGSALASPKDALRVEMQGVDGHWVWPAGVALIPPLQLTVLEQMLTVTGEGLDLILVAAGMIVAAVWWGGRGGHEGSRGEKGRRGLVESAGQECSQPGHHPWTAASAAAGLGGGRR
mmetsp:Transcript_9477/g.27278  ORF Transcript_9477/g.27278 Transcript_9477/m.27278 type:complete len:234 (+) Transcript_9477:1421-2122(+)